MISICHETPHIIILTQVHSFACTVIKVCDFVEHTKYHRNTEQHEKNGWIYQLRYIISIHVKISSIERYLKVNIPGAVVILSFVSTKVLAPISDEKVMTSAPRACAFAYISLCWSVLTHIILISAIDSNWTEEPQWWGGKYPKNTRGTLLVFLKTKI